MSHRTTDPRRIRTAHHDAIDSEAATRIMSREWLGATPRERGERDRHPTADPAAVASLADDLARVAVLPAVLDVACTIHDAAVGAWCYRGVRGVCAARLDRRPRDV